MISFVPYRERSSYYCGSDKLALKARGIQYVFVGDPVERNGKIYFTVKGFDSVGEFEVQRRYSDFDALRKSFT